MLGVARRFKSGEDLGPEPSTKPRVKTKKSVDLTLALKRSASMNINEKELKSLDKEDDPTEVVTSYRKHNKSYIHEINNNLLSSEIRWAVQKSNREKKLSGTSEKMSGIDEKLKEINALKSHSAASKLTKPTKTGKNFGPSWPNKSSAKRNSPKLAQSSPQAQPKSETNVEPKNSPPEPANSIPKTGVASVFNSSTQIPRRPSMLNIHRKGTVRIASKVGTTPFDSKRHASARKTDATSQWERVLDRNSTLLEKGTISVANAKLVQAKPLEKSQIPKLAHRLDRTLFSPGVHFLQDPRTRVYNFPPFLKNVIYYEDFDFSAISRFTNVSKDELLLKLAIKNNKQFYSSTSSMTSALTQFYFLLNNYNPRNKRRFDFPSISGLLSSLPASLIMRRRGVNPRTQKSIYAVESDHSYDQEILLSAMGQCLETFLTTEEKEFEKFNLANKSAEAPLTPENVYNYSTFGEFLMRSQLDCYDERLPGNGTFDLKTRAVCSIRYDSANPDLQNNKYQIWKLKGKYESFGREFDDLIKTGALLKYLFQARIGQMDGIFIAYHNINSLFGFQYLPLEELDNIFYNHKNNEIFRHTTFEKDAVDLKKINDRVPTFVGETQFKQSLKIWENIMKLVIKASEKQDESFRLFMKAKRFHNETKTRLYVFAVPITEQQIHTLQRIPKNFETSFRDDITAEQRSENVQAHRDELTKFNESMIRGALGRKIQAYCVDINEQIIDNYRHGQSLSPYPHRVTDDWKLGYKIQKMNNNTKEQIDSIRSLLLELLEVPMQALTGSYEKSNDKENRDFHDILKVYSKIGKARAEEWFSKDSNPVIYEPKQSNESCK